MPRLRIHETSADRQRAYRERLKESASEAIIKPPALTVAEAHARLPRIPAAHAMLDALLYHEFISTEAAVSRVLKQWGSES